MPLPIVDRQRVGRSTAIPQAPDGCRSPSEHSEGGDRQPSGVLSGLGCPQKPTPNRRWRTRWDSTRASRRRLHACRLTHKPLDFAHEDVRECGDSFGPKPKKPPQTLRHGDHPLPHGDRWNDVIDQVRRGLRHAPAVARWADAPPLAREGHEKIVTAGAAPCPGKPKAENPAAEVAP